MRDWRVERLVTIYQTTPIKVVDIPTPNKWSDLSLLHLVGLVRIKTGRYEKGDMVVRIKQVTPDRIREIFAPIGKVEEAV